MSEIDDHLKYICDHDPGDAFVTVALAIMQVDVFNHDHKEFLLCCIANALTVSLERAKQNMKWHER